MYAQPTLKDAFNREVYPNTAGQGQGQGQGQIQGNSYGAGSMGGGAGAYDQMDGQFASYQSDNAGPNYQVPYNNSYAQQTQTQQSSCDSCEDNSYGNQGMNNYGSNSQSSSHQYPPQPPNYGMMLQQMNNQPNVQVEEPKQQSIYEMLISYLKQTVEIVTGQLNINPDWVDTTPDGGACWKYSTMVRGNSLWCRVFNKVELNAERKACKHPLPHLTTLTTTTKIKLSDDIWKELQDDFPMVSYCSSTKDLRITMDSLEHNLAMLSLICAAQQGKLSLSKIKYYELPKKYLLLTTPGHAKYHRGAKFSLVRMIRQ